MNCCNHNPNDNQANGSHEHKGIMSHMWMMVLCCAAPLVLLVVIALLGSRIPGLKILLISILPFVCPIMMVGMIPMMFMHRKHGKKLDEKDNELNSSKESKNVQKL